MEKYYRKLAWYIIVVIFGVIKISKMIYSAVLFGKADILAIVALLVGWRVYRLVRKGVKISRLRRDNQL